MKTAHSTGDEHRKQSAGHQPLHEALGGAIGAIGAAGLGGMVGGPLGAFVGAIVGAGMGSYASWAADSNAAELLEEDREEHGKLQH